MSMVADESKPKPRAAKQTATSKLFDEPDQNRIRADLSVFFGPNADTFLETYEKMRSKTGTRRTTPRTWSWQVFLGSFVWFFYRKIYAYGAMIILLPIILGYLFASASGGGSMAIVCAIFAKGWYVNSALQRIVKADQLGLTGPERISYLQRAGGVSLAAGLFAGFIYAIILAALIYTIARPSTGHP